MAENNCRPIIMSAPMVRAILEGRKTQTRRVVTGNPGRVFWIQNVISGSGGWCDEHGRPVPCHYGEPGDTLWVREKWRVGAWDEDQGTFAIDYSDGPLREWRTIPGDDDGSLFAWLWVDCCDELRAKGIEPGEDGRYHWQPGDSPLRWRSPIHMPRWASRIKLEVTGVRVERLQDISEEDAVAEGMTRELREALGWHAEESEETFNSTQARSTFGVLWDSISGPSSWAKNPGVWVIEFRRS